MKKLFTLLAVAAALAFAAAPQPSHASYGSFLCAPNPAEGAVGPRRITNPATSNSYPLNSSGCAFIANADVAYAMSQGFSGGWNVWTASQVGITANTTSQNSLILPAGAYIHNIIIGETAGNAVSGGVDIGTAASGAQIASAIAVAGNALVGIPDASLLKRTFGTGSAPAQQQIFFACHTACNSASLNVTVIYSLF